MLSRLPYITWDAHFWGPVYPGNPYSLISGLLLKLTKAWNLTLNYLRSLLSPCTIFLLSSFALFSCCIFSSLIPSITCLSSSQVWRAHWTRSLRTAFSSHHCLCSSEVCILSWPQILCIQIHVCIIKVYHEVLWKVTYKPDGLWSLDAFCKT